MSAGALHVSVAFPVAASRAIKSPVTSCGVAHTWSFVPSQSRSHVVPSPSASKMSGVAASQSLSIASALPGQKRVDVQAAEPVHPVVKIPPERLHNVHHPA